MRSCNKFKEVIHTKKREDLPLVQREEKRSKKIYRRANKKEIYLAIKIVSDCTYIFCKKEE